MLGKGNRLYSIFRNKCPRCHEGKMFTHNNPYNLTNFYQMEERCEVCDEKYEKEPGFFFGAMFVSYALNVVWFVTGWVATMVLLPEDFDILLLASIIIGFGLIMAPLTYRLSRLIWINFFVSYRTKEEREKIKEMKLHKH